MVYGDKAFPLLRMRDKDVTLMAGAEVGNGRVLAASHNEYIKLFKGKLEFKNGHLKGKDFRSGRMV